MTPASKPEYRRVRNGWGLALATAWIIYRWMGLAAEKRAALAGLLDCDGLIDATKCAISKGAIDGGFAGGVMFAVLLSPLAFIIAHYIARWQVERQESAEQQRAEQAQADAQLVQQREREQRVAAMEGDASKTRQSLDRGEFMHKLGTVSDFIELLAHESEPARVANIRLGAVQALRDLTAKHPLDQLTRMLADDAGVRLSLETVLGRLQTAALDGSSEAQILIASLRGAKLRLTPDGVVTPINAAT